MPESLFFNKVVGQACNFVHTEVKPKSAKVVHGTFFTFVSNKGYFEVLPSKVIGFLVKFKRKLIYNLVQQKVQ